MGGGDGSTGGGSGVTGGGSAVTGGGDGVTGGGAGGGTVNGGTGCGCSSVDSSLFGFALLALARFGRRRVKA